MGILLILNMVVRNSFTIILTLIYSVAGILVFFKVTNPLFSEEEILGIPFPIFVVVLLLTGMVNYLLLFMSAGTRAVLYVENLNKKSGESEAVSKESSSYELENLTQQLSQMAESAVVSKEVLFNYLCKAFQAGQALMYESDFTTAPPVLNRTFTFSLYHDEHNKKQIEFGEGFTGAAAVEQRVLIIADIPENYVRFGSGLGSSVPSALLVIPICYGSETIGVVELATCMPENKINDGRMLEELPLILGKVMAADISKNLTSEANV